MVTAATETHSSSFAKELIVDEYTKIMNEINIDKNGKMSFGPSKFRLNLGGLHRTRPTGATARQILD